MISPRGDDKKNFSIGKDKKLFSSYAHCLKSNLNTQNNVLAQTKPNKVINPKLSGIRWVEMQSQRHNPINFEENQCQRSHSIDSNIISTAGIRLLQSNNSLHNNSPKWHKTRKPGHHLKPDIVGNNLSLQNKFEILGGDDKLSNYNNNYSSPRILTP